MKAVDGIAIGDRLSIAVPENGSVSEVAPFEIFTETGFPTDTVVIVPVYSVMVSRTNTETGGAVPGARLQLINSDGETVDTWISAADEAHKISGLEAEKEYTLHEEASPAGYLTPADQTFTIGTDHEVTYTGSSTTDSSGQTGSARCSVSARADMAHSPFPDLYRLRRNMYS